MENFRRQFLLEAVATLRRILADLQTAEKFSEPLKRETFRVLHTVKGTAQTFGFDAASRLAHELESLAADENSFALLLEGIEFLIESLNDENFQLPPQFAEKIRFAAPLTDDTSITADILPPEVPREIFSQLSMQEKNRLYSAISENKNLSGLEIEFDLANFAEDLIKFRESLNRNGEIIATFPASKTSTNGKIGFQLLVAGSEILPPLEEFGATVRFQRFAEKINGAVGILNEIARYGKSLAARFDKKIEFKIRADETDLAPERLKIIFDALVHLVRNAVDHAIVESGTIGIDLSSGKSGIRLTVSDDGSGFDSEKIKAKAVEKSLIDDAAHLNEKELIDLIFLPEFSTKTELTEISGRGIGLDAVKSIVEQNGGQIIAANRAEKGATFEIVLPG